MQAKRVSRREFLGAAAVGVAGAGLAACVPAAPAEEDVGAMPEEITITYSFPIPEADYLGATQKALAEKHDFRVPDTNVVVDVQLGVASEAVDLAMSAGDPPDVFWHRYQQSTIDAINEGLYENAQELMEADGISLDIYADGPRDAYSPAVVDGKMWAFPYEVVIHLWAYNPVLFDEAGVEPPDKNWTWTDALEIGVQMTWDDEGRHPNEDGFNINEVEVWGMGPWFYFGGEEHYPRIAGGEYTNEDVSEITITGPPFTQTIDWFRELFRTPIAIEARPEKGLQTGRIAIYETGNWALLGLKQDMEELGAVYPPTHPDTNLMSTVLPDKELWIPKKEGGAQLDAAYKFAKWWSHDMYIEYALETGYIPYLKRDLEDPRWLELIANNPFMQVAEEMVQYGHARFWSLFPGAFEAWPVMHEMWSAISATDTPAEQLLEDAQTECQRIMDKYRA